MGPNRPLLIGRVLLIVGSGCAVLTCAPWRQPYDSPAAGREPHNFTMRSWLLHRSAVDPVFFTLWDNCFSTLVTPSLHPMLLSRGCRLPSGFLVLPTVLTGSRRHSGPREEPHTAASSLDPKFYCLGPGGPAGGSPVGNLEALAPAGQGIVWAAAPTYRLQL